MNSIETEMNAPRLLLVAADQIPPSVDWEHDVLPDYYIIRSAEVETSELAVYDVDAALIAADPLQADVLALVEAIHRADVSLPIVIWNPNMTAQEAVQLVRGGASHCFGLGDSESQLREWLRRAVEERRARGIANEHSTEPWCSLLVGESRAMRTVAETIRLVGPRRCTVLITGETGTGKEVAAKALHMASPRAQQPLVAVNCSALPEHLLEAELFGHVKGAFTGATNLRLGRFELANKGTIFLDEIGDMPLDLQAKLLRVLQEREIQRLGSSETIKVDVRVIAATNMNLLDRVREGKFRLDLYYRLNVVPLSLPPLRQRERDIDLLVSHFVKKVCQAEGLPLKTVSGELLADLRRREWPGNVRQLENAVEMAVVMSGERELLCAADFGLMPVRSTNIIGFRNENRMPEISESLNFESAVNEFERSILNHALQRTGGNKTAAAELLGLKRTTLIMKLRAFQNFSACQAV